MGLIARYLWPSRGRATAPQEARSISVEDLAALMTGGYETRAGANVTVETALQVTAVLACVRVIAEGVAQIPLKVYRRTDDRREEARDLDIYKLLTRRPNAWQTAFEFREGL